MSLLGAFKQWLDAVEAGADPIEALHGHVCSPDCWHNQIPRNVCRGCRRSTDSVIGSSGDFSVCCRCHKSITSQTGLAIIERKRR